MWTPRPQMTNKMSVYVTLNNKNKIINFNKNQLDVFMVFEVVTTNNSF